MTTPPPALAGAVYDRGYRPYAGPARRPAGRRRSPCGA